MFCEAQAALWLPSALTSKSTLTLSRRAFPKNACQLSNHVMFHDASKKYAK
jgi:hypothetical protein